MILNVSLTVTKIERFRNRNVGGERLDYGRGSCNVSQEVQVSGTWEFESHPNLDAYAFSTGAPKDSVELLLQKCGFDPNWDYEIDFRSIEVEISGNDDEWFKQAKNLHDGYWKDEPQEALEKMAKWDESHLTQTRAERIANKFD